jgi:predicted secreted protein
MMLFYHAYDIINLNVRSWNQRLHMGRLKMTKLKAVILVFFFTLFQSTFYDTMWACDKSANQETMIVLQKQNGEEITVKASTLIQIKLAELGSAGYTWQVNNLDSEYMELISEKIEVSEESNIGAPVIHVWCFKAKKAGMTEIKMDYYRQWEGIKKSQDHFFIKIKFI